MNRVVFLVSSNGGNFKFFDLAIKNKIIKNSELFVIADRPCGAIEYAKTKGIINCIIRYNREHNVELKLELNKIKPDVIKSTWKKIIDSDLVLYYFGRIVNIHYSLLPSLGGLIGVKPIEKALELGCKYIGPTCHIVDEGVDSGKILSQDIFKTNNIDFDFAVENMFKKGCICLLDGVNQVVKSPIIESINPSLFDNEFWNELSSL